MSSTDDNLVEIFAKVLCTLFDLHPSSRKATGSIGFYIYNIKDLGVVIENFTLSPSRCGGGFVSRFISASTEVKRGSSCLEVFPHFAINILLPLGTQLLLSSPRVSMWPEVNHVPIDNIPSNLVMVRFSGRCISTNVPKLNETALDFFLKCLPYGLKGLYTKLY